MAPFIRFNCTPSALSVKSAAIPPVWRNLRNSPLLRTSCSSVSALIVFTHGSEKRADVVNPQLRLLERGEVPATLHRREVHDVVARFGGLARFGADRVHKVSATIVL